jgi:GTP-binding protein
MFYDQARINVAAGKGGNGSLSFRHEKHVPRGGPDGGDGGRGGNVVVFADPQARDLQPFTYKVHFKGGAGQPGQGARKNGSRGETVRIGVPLGTQIFLDDSLLADIVDPGSEVVVAHGGPGGRGNARFVTSTRQAPHFAELGEEGETFWLTLSLKLMADAGLAGLPNAGKSSLLRRLSNAKPKVAAYPFTTLEPMLGVVDWSGEGDTFTLADIPGLLEGASEGVGLGDRFLSHLERCELIVHVVDVTGYYGEAPLEGFRTILGELDAHAPELGHKPQIVVLNKIDAVDEHVVDEMGSVFRHEVKRLRQVGHPAFSFELAEGSPPLQRMVWPASAVSGAGLHAFVRWVGPIVEELRARRTESEPLADVGALSNRDGDGIETRRADGHVTYRPRGAGSLFAIREEAGTFVVEGKAVKRLVERFDLNNDEAVRYLGERLERLGVSTALRAHGVKPGDNVEIEGHPFDFE